MSEAMMSALGIQVESLGRQLAEVTATNAGLTEENARVRALLTEFDQRHAADQAEIDALRRAPVSAGKVKAADDMASAIEAEAEARALYLGTAPDRGGLNGPKGQRRAALEASQTAAVLAARSYRALQPGDGWQGNGHRFKIGQKVQVSSTYEHAGDWRDQVLTIIGVDLAPDGITHSYTTADGVSRGTWDCPTDGWAEADLSPASLPLGEETR